MYYNLLPFARCYYAIATHWPACNLIFLSPCLLFFSCRILCFIYLATSSLSLTHLTRSSVAPHLVLHAAYRYRGLAAF